jgi:hypothetical protein
MAQVRHVAREYGVAHCTIVNWRRRFAVHQQSNHRFLPNITAGVAQDATPDIVRHGYQRRVMGPDKRTLHSGTMGSISEWVKVALWRWFCDLREKKIKVTVDDFVHEYTCINYEECASATKHALRQRIYRLLHSLGITCRYVTHVSQNTIHCRITIDDFVAYIKQIISRYGISLGNVVNGDETNCDWAVSPKKTLNKKGAKTCEANACSSSGRSTVLLCVSAAGVKLEPFVIYTGSKKGTIAKKELRNSVSNGYPLHMHYTTQKSAWMDEETMLEWIEVVWKPFTDMRPGLFLLILDEARAHLTEKVSKRLSELRTIYEIIPGGYTSKLQVLDVGINRPFKHYYKEASESFVRHWVNGHVPGEKPHPLRQDVAKWILHAWGKISKATIMSTWRHVGYIKTSDVNFYVDTNSSDRDY